MGVFINRGLMVDLIRKGGLYCDTDADKEFSVNRIMSLPAIDLDVAEWVPVEEGLPEEEKMVLVTCQAKNGHISVNRAYYMDGFWHGSGSMAGVTAWMPLPDPYRKDGEA